MKGLNFSSQKNVTPKVRRTKRLLAGGGIALLAGGIIMGLYWSVQLLVPYNLQYIAAGGALQIALIVLAYIFVVKELRLRRQLAKRTQLLNKEVQQREAAEAGLQRAYEDVEAKITQRTEDLGAAKAQLERTGALLGATFHAMRTGVLVCLEERSSVIANHALAEMWNLGAEPEGGWRFETIATAIEAATSSDPQIGYTLRNLQHNLELTDERVLRLKNKRLIEVHTEPFYVGEAPMGRLFSFKDITQTERAQERLRTAVRELRFFKRALDAHALVSITNEHGVIQYANEYFSHVSGYAQEELVGSKHSRVNSGHHPESYFKDLWATVMRGEVWRGEIQNLSKEGNVYWVNATIVPFLDEAGRPFQFLSIAALVTQQKRAEAQLISAKESAENAMRVKSDFLANMSHEIRTPMNAILGFANLVREETDKPRHKEYLDLLTSSGRALLDIINDLLDYSKLEAGGFSIQTATVDIRTLVHECYEVFAFRAHEKGLTWVIDVSDDVPQYVQSDEVRLRQILFNLISNAIKFTAEGTITLQVDAAFNLPQAPNTGTGADTDTSPTCTLQFSVQDTGIGIAPDERERIFEAFIQAEGQNIKQYGGTGLGLSIARRLVELLGGELLLDSAPGEGSTFTVNLKQVAVTAAPPGSDNVRLPQLEALGTFTTLGSGTLGTAGAHLNFKPATILIVDDEASNRKLIRSFLRHTPITVQEALGGEQALELATETPPDLMLVDYLMQGMDGVETLTQLRKYESTKNIPVLLITAVGKRKFEAEHPNAGFDDILPKPLSRESLLHTLAQYIPTDGADAVEQPSARARESAPPFNSARTSTHAPMPTTSSNTRQSTPPMGIGTAASGAFKPGNTQAPTLAKPAITLLTGPLHIQWKALSVRLKTADAIAFAQQLSSVDSSEAWEPVRAYCQQLEQAASRLEISQLHTLLAAYPSIVSWATE